MRVRLTIACLVLAGCSGGAGVMDGIMQSWQGAPLDAVIAQWGYPDQEQNIGGHHIFRWYLTKQYTMPATATVNTVGQTSFVSVDGGGTITGNCTRTLEVDQQNTVIRWEWSGNNCPFSEFPSYTNWRRKG